MKYPKISVILPVFKAQDTIKRCIDSILNQEYDNWELLLIDDGSPDASGALCDQYSDSDFRIKVIHKKNEGVSIARNIGLDNATGEWVTFIDSDDWLEGDVFSIVKEFNNDVQLLIFDNTDVYENKALVHHYDENILSGRKLKDTFYKYMFDPVFLGPWSKFFRMDVIRQFCLRYDPQIKWAEDRLFNMSFISHIKAIGFAGRGNYMYLQPSGNQSLMKYHVSINMVSVLYERMREITKQMDFRHISYAYSVFWQKIEKISLLDSNYNEVERRVFYKKNFTLRTIKDMKWYHVLPFIACAILPHSWCIWFMKPYLGIEQQNQ